MTPKEAMERAVEVISNRALWTVGNFTDARKALVENKDNFNQAQLFYAEQLILELNRMGAK